MLSWVAVLILLPPADPGGPDAAKLAEQLRKQPTARERAALADQIRQLDSLDDPARTSLVLALVEEEDADARYAFWKAFEKTDPDNAGLFRQLMLHASLRGVRKYKDLPGIHVPFPDKHFAALIKLGPKARFAIPLLLDLAPADNRFPDTILAIDPDHEKAFELICANAKSRTPKVRLAAIESLQKAAKSRNAKAVQTLTAILRLHTDAPTVTAVAQSLPRYGKDARPALPVLGRFKNSRDLTIRDAANKAIEEIEKAGDESESEPTARDGSHDDSETPRKAGACNAPFAV